MLSGPPARPRRTLLSWSSGKDSAWTLYTLQQDPDVELVGLLTTLNEEVDRVAMHGVRRALLEAQAEAAGLPLIAVPLPSPCTDAQYQKRMAAAFEQVRDMGVEEVAFGDLFLEDVRDYRIAQMQDTGIQPRFPLWGRDTAELGREMVAAGLRAVLACVDTAQLDAAFLGRVYDATVLDELPDTCDPCGEKGEFHTFVTAGPMFGESIAVQTGERVERDSFHFIDLLPTAVREEVTR